MKRRQRNLIIAGLFLPIILMAIVMFEVISHHRQSPIDAVDASPSGKPDLSYTNPNARASIVIHEGTNRALWTVNGKKPETH